MSGVDGVMRKPSNPGAWEREFTAAMARYFSGIGHSWEDAALGGRVTVEDVRLEGSYAWSNVVVIVRDDTRPAC